MPPDETEARAKLRTVFEEEFDQLAALQVLSVSLIPFPLRIDSHSTIDRSVVDVALGLYVKACRQIRGIQLLCEAGLGSDAYALTRHLFETTLALSFVLSPRVVLRQDGKRLPKVKGRPFSTRFRARLYIANLAFERERMLRRWKATKGLKRRGVTTLDVKAIQKRAQDGAAVIGPEWTARLRRSRSYSGLTIKDLAASLDFRTSYETFYRMSSWPAHAIDADAPFTGEFTLDIAPSARGVAKAISSASLLILKCCDDLNSALRLGKDADIAVRAARLGA